MEEDMYVCVCSCVDCVCVCVFLLFTTAFWLVLWGLWRWQIASKTIASKGHYEFSSLSVFLFIHLFLIWQKMKYLFWITESRSNLQLLLWFDRTSVPVSLQSPVTTSDVLFCFLNFEFWIWACCSSPKKFNLQWYKQRNKKQLCS